MKFSMAIEKKNRANIGTVEGHNARTHPTTSQLPKSSWITPQGHHQVVAFDAVLLENRRVWPSGRMQFWPWNWSFRWEIRPIGESFLLLNTPRQA